MYRHLLEKLLHRSGFDHVDQPLLDQQELIKLKEFATSLPAESLYSGKMSHQLLMGEQLSPYSGSGYEFADNRSFQQGDDRRHINWRLYARSGELYRKLFHEERRPQLSLVVDRRSAMRFGTCKRLKVTAAVTQALTYLYQAQQQQIATACLLLDESLQWLEPNKAPADLVDELNRACPPLETGTHHYDFSQVMRQLQVRLQPGSVIIIFSDLHDFDAESVKYLYQLGQTHRVTAVHVLDDVETRLPQKGQFHFSSSGSETALQVDADDADSRREIEETLERHNKIIESQVNRSGVSYRRLMTSDDPFQQ